MPGLLQSAKLAEPSSERPAPTTSTRGELPLAVDRSHFIPLAERPTNMTQLHLRNAQHRGSGQIVQPFTSLSQHERHMVSLRFASHHDADAGRTQGVL